MLIPSFLHSFIGRITTVANGIGIRAWIVFPIKVTNSYSNTMYTFWLAYWNWSRSKAREWTVPLWIGHTRMKIATANVYRPVWQNSTLYTERLNVNWWGGKQHTDHATTAEISINAHVRQQNRGRRSSRWSFQSLFVTLLAGSMGYREILFDSIAALPSTFSSTITVDDSNPSIPIGMYIPQSVQSCCHRINDYFDDTIWQRVMFFVDSSAGLTHWSRLPFRGRHI